MHVKKNSINKNSQVILFVQMNDQKLSNI